MKDSNMRHLVKLKSQPIKIEQFKEEILEIVCSEVKAINAPNEKLLKIVDLLSCLQFPLKISTHIVIPEKKSENKIDIASITGTAIMGIVVNRLLKKCSAIPTITLSLGAAFAVGLGIKQVFKKEKKKIAIEQQVDSTVEEIAANIDKLIDIISNLLIEKKQLLNENYLNIIEWYQQAYADCDDFGEECADYFKKRIESILLANDYYLYNYNGKNGELFRKTIINDITSVKQQLPAISNKKGFVLTGIIFMPLK